MTFPILGDQSTQQQPQTEGPPPPPEPTEEMRFMIRLQDNPDLPDYMEPLGLFRFQVTPDVLITDRFDREKDMWVYWPDMLGFTGLGGADNYREVREEEANQLIEQWGGGEIAVEGEEAPAEGDDDVASALYGDALGDYQSSAATPEEVQQDIKAEQDEAQRIGEMGLDEVEAEIEAKKPDDESFGELGERGFNLTGSLRRLTDDEEEEEEESDY